MSDTTVNQFLSQADDAAARTGFVPAPPTPAADLPNGYLCFQRDTGALYAWNSSSVAWVLITSGSVGSSIPTTVQGDTLYASAANTLTALAKDTNATRYLSNTGATNNPAWAQVNLANGVTGDLPFANLTQGSALSVLGVTGNATADNASIAAASDHQVLRRSGTTVAFGAVNLAQSAAVTGVLPVANGGTGSASGAGLLRGTVTLTDAQVKALPTSSITIVAAPGAGFYINWQAIELLSFFSAGAYTGLNATYCIIAASVNGLAVSVNIVNDSTTTPALTSLTRLLGAANRRARLVPYLEAVGTGEMYVIPSSADGTVNIDPIASLDDKALVIFADNNGSGNFTGGNAANTLKVTAYYTIEATT